MSFKKFANTDTSAYGAPLAMAGELTDVFNRPDQFGRASTGVTTAKGAMSGAAAGASLGPVGMGVGALAGGIAGFFTQRRANMEGNNLESTYNRNLHLANLGRSASSYAQSGAGGTYGQNWFGKGGPMNAVPHAKFNVKNGELKPLSKDSKLAIGPKHADGGIKIPSHNAEIEGDETIWNDNQGEPYVFSDRIQWSKNKTFAGRHEELARAQGRAERNPAPEARVTEKMLAKQQGRLQQEQEMIREYYYNKLLSEYA